jgi:hypothetical protein
VHSLAAATFSPDVEGNITGSSSSRKWEVALGCQVLFKYNDLAFNDTTSNIDTPKEKDSANAFL